jgi:hypothetical protein
MRRLIVGLGLAAGLVLGQTGGALAASPVVKTTIWLDGAVVRTLLPPAATPQEGTDPFFMVPGTGGVAAMGPGDPGYHGGHWAVYVVSWNVDPYQLRSYAAIMAADDAGHISISRNAAADFLCPIQGN